MQTNFNEKNATEKQIIKNTFTSLWSEDDSISAELIYDGNVINLKAEGKISDEYILNLVLSAINEGDNISIEPVFDDNNNLISITIKVIGICELIEDCEVILDIIAKDTEQDKRLDKLERLDYCELVKECLPEPFGCADLIDCEVILEIQNEITGIKSKITVIEGQITTINSTLTNHNSRITTNANNITNLTGRVGNLETTVVNHSNRITKLENLDYCELVKNCFDGGDFKFDCSMIENCDVIIALRNDITTINNTLANHNTRITTNTNNITNLTTRVTTAESTLISHNTRITNNTTNITNLTTRVTTAEGRITTNTNNITNLTARVAALEALDYCAIFADCDGTTPGDTFSCASVMACLGIVTMRNDINDHNSRIEALEALDYCELIKNCLPESNKFDCADLIDCEIILQIQDNITKLRNDVTVIQGNIITINSTLVNHGGRLNTIEGGLTTISNTLLNHNTRITNNTNQITTINDLLYQIQLEIQYILENCCDKEDGVEFDCDMIAHCPSILSIWQAISQINIRIDNLDLSGGSFDCEMLDACDVIIQIKNNITTIQGQISVINNILNEHSEELIRINSNLSNVMLRVNTIESQITVMQGQITTLNSNVNNLTVRLNGVDFDISLIKGRLDILEALDYCAIFRGCGGGGDDNDGFSCEAVMACAGIQAILRKDNEQDARLTALEARPIFSCADLIDCEIILTIQSNITNLRSDVSVIQGQITTINSTLTSHNNRLTTVEGNITTINNTLANHNTRITNNATNITNLTTRVDRVESTVNNHNERITKLENLDYCELVKDCVNNFDFDCSMLANCDVITTLQSNVSNLQVNVANNTTAITTINSTLIGHNIRITNLENLDYCAIINSCPVVIQIGNKITVIEGNITTINTKLESQDKRIDALENIDYCELLKGCIDPCELWEQIKEKCPDVEPCNPCADFDKSCCDGYYKLERIMLDWFYDNRASRDSWVRATNEFNNETRRFFQDCMGESYHTYYNPIPKSITVWFTNVGIPVGSTMALTQRMKEHIMSYYNDLLRHIISTISECCDELKPEWDFDAFIPNPPPIVFEPETGLRMTFDQERWQFTVARA